MVCSLKFIQIKIDKIEIPHFKSQVIINQSFKKKQKTNLEQLWTNLEQFWTNLE